jgi:ABC-2 type transport system permease protein
LPPISVDYRAWYNPNLNDREFFVPGIIANVVLIATMILTAMTVVREREIGTLERLMVTPLARLEFVVGKIVPVACIGMLDVILVTLVAVLWFGVPFRGDALALVIGTLLYLMSTLGMGLVISSFSSTQQQAMLTAVFFIMPLVILSGFAFPIRNMPEPVQYLTLIDPLRYYLVVIRDIFLKGGGIGDHLFEYGMMALLGIIMMGLSMTRIR